MATWDDVRELALALPGVEEGLTFGSPSWKAGRLVVWERPLRAKEIAEVGAQDGPVLGARVEDEGVKLALLEEDPEVFFTTAHFDGWSTILVRLDRIDRARLAELVEEAWISVAPRRLVAAHLAGRGGAD